MSVHQEVLIRAHTGLSKNTIYMLINTAMPLVSIADWPLNIKANCSGFVCWCYGNRFPGQRIYEQNKTDRFKEENDNWFETTAVFKDATLWNVYWESVDNPEPGDLIVYPDQNGDSGHIGIINEVYEGTSGLGSIKSVIHCSSGNYKQSGDAIRVTQPTVWIKNPNSVIARFIGD